MPDFAPHDLTSNTSHSPFVVSGTGTVYGQYRAFESGDSGGFGFPYYTNVSSGSAYLQLDIGSGNSKILFTYAIRAGDDPTLSPQAWTVRGSTDNFSSSDVLLDTVIGQTGWTTGEFRSFSCDVINSAFRYFKFIFTAAGPSPSFFLKLDEIYLYDSSADVFINSLTFNSIFSFDPDTNQALNSHGVADIFLGNATNTPGSVLESGEGDIYNDGVQIAKHIFSNALPVDGSGTVVTAIFDSPSGVDATPAMVWYDIQGAVLTIGAVNSYKIYAMYIRMALSDGTIKFSYPSVQIVESFSGPAAGTVTNADNAIDLNENTFAEINRTNFSGLAIPTYLRVSAFGPFVIPILNCNNPPNGATLQSYSHQLTTSNAIGPFTWSIIGGVLPPGLNLSTSTGAISGTPTAPGTFNFVVSAVNDIYSLSTSCSINVTESFPVTTTTCVFEFYGLERPEQVEVLPVPKKFDQLGPVRFDKIGKVFGFRVRLIMNGLTTTVPFSVYGDDSTTSPAGASPLYSGSFIVAPGRDQVIEVQFPKNVNTDIFRLTLGPVTDSFHRYNVFIKVQTSGMESESKWMPIQ